jgi:hypothetical protein
MSPRGFHLPTLGCSIPNTYFLPDAPISESEHKVKRFTLCNKHSITHSKGLCMFSLWTYTAEPVPFPQRVTFCTVRIELADGESIWAETPY